MKFARAEIDVVFISDDTGHWRVSARLLPLSTSEPLYGYIIVTSILFVTLVTSGTHSGGLGAVIALCY